MKTTTNGIQLIKRFEGFRAKAYKCPAGIWTIGYGTTANITPGTEITESAASNLLRSHLYRLERKLSILNLEINQNQFDALISLIYNIGFSAFSKSTLLKRIQSNAAESEISYQLLRWNKADGRILPGLIVRREAELKLYYS